ncbi:MAG: type II secretion system protein GspM [Xanthomonadaceae bacterium]|jgi:general secretion pathway protein M|nr:type II secretion system protein GspM [Xanthomonadaceae bacterium]
MQLLPSPERGRFVALGLLVAALAIVYFAGVHWWFTARHVEIATEMGDLRDQEARFRRVADERPAVEARLAEVRQFEAGNPAFLAETDFDSAAAGLTQRLKQIVGEHARDAQSCQIIMNQYSRPTEKELFERASIRVRLRCSLEEFAPILYDLEAGSPMLFVDELQVWKQTGYRAPGSNQVTSYLDVQFTLSGYMRQRVATGKEGA